MDLWSEASRERESILTVSPAPEAGGSPSHTGDTLRGREARYARHDELEIRLPPDWSGGYTSIFEHQQAS